MSLDGGAPRVKFKLPSHPGLDDQSGTVVRVAQRRGDLAGVAEGAGEYRESGHFLLRVSGASVEGKRCN